MATAAKTAPKAASFDPMELRELSPRAKDYIRRYPDEAQQIATYVMEAVARKETGTTEIESDGMIVRIPKRLKPFLDSGQHGPGMIGSAEAADRLEVSQTTVGSWVRKREMVAWKRPKLGLTIPEEQILQPKVVVVGTRKTLEIIGDPGLTWTFLEMEWPFDRGAARPIDMLKEGYTGLVWFAARVFGMSPA